MSRIDDVAGLFREGFNCAQALFAVYGEALGIDRRTALKVASAFGGGIGRRGDTCGAVTGALMVIGLKHGATEKREQGKNGLQQLVETFLRDFQKRNQTVMCRNLLGFDIGSREEISAEDRRIIEEKCPGYVTDAAEIIEDILMKQVVAGPDHEEIKPR